MIRASLCATLLGFAASVAAEPPVLGLPIDCVMGETCYIQNQVDRDAGPGARDYRCGALTYDGHKGTDFGVPTFADMRLGVDVLASAPGIVRGLRDGVDDVGPTRVTKGRECGNGVVLRHVDGWETQYCHMKSGSVLVQNGQSVKRGDVLGQVGFSGQTEFPHVHLSVRYNGKVVDPFDLSTAPGCDEKGVNLWQNLPEYAPGGLLDAGFSPGLPEYDVIKDGTAHYRELAADAPGLVIYGFGYASRKGDEMDLQITGPMGNFLTRSVKLDKDQAQFFRASGKQLTQSRWPAGRYTGIVTLRRGTRVLGMRKTETVIR